MLPRSSAKTDCEGSAIQKAVSMILLNMVIVSLLNLVTVFQ
jgi:hypothetical protein